MGQKATAIATKATREERALLLSFVGIVIAFLSVLVAAYTAWVSRDASMRQLRAYVFVENPGLQIHGLDEMKPQIITISYKNVGQTPAINLKTRAWARLGPWPPEKMAWKRPVSADTEQPQTLAQGGSASAVVNPNRGFTAEEVSLLDTGALRRYVYGTISYSDVFGNEHRTDFCFASVPHDPLRGDLQMVGCNQSDMQASAP